MLGELFIQQDKWQDWAYQYNRRLESICERAANMKKLNPKFIARNHLLQQAIEKAETNNNYSDIQTLSTLLQAPFGEHTELDEYSKPSKDSEKYLATTSYDYNSNLTI